MTKVEQLRLALLARDAAKNCAEWEGINSKVRELTHDLLPHLLEAAEFLGDVRDLLANHPEADEGNSKVHFILCNAKGLLKELTR